jgi:hypothetical protein
MTKPFHERRRQKFLYEKLYENTRMEQIDAVSLCRRDLASLRREATLNHQYIEAAQAFVYHEKFWLWMLDYTGGISIEDLAPCLKEVVDEFVVWHEVNIPYRQSLKEEFKDRDVQIDVSPVDFVRNQIDYEDALQLVSVALMLRDAVSVKRIIAAMHSVHGFDELYDSLVSGYMPEGTPQSGELQHEQPYRLLMNCWYEQDEQKTIDLVKAYCKAWYKAQDGSRWHDGHLKVHQDAAPYYGYWAFEAGAACYLLDIDDSSIDHMVYPKDLVAYARQLRAEGRWTSDDDIPVDTATRRLRALHGEPVPEGGTWTTPAIPGDAGRIQLQVGERLPETAYTDWGEVIWYLEH